MGTPSFTTRVSPFASTPPPVEATTQRRRHRPRQDRRKSIRATVTALLGTTTLAAVIGLLASTAFADNTLVSSTPANNAALEISPTSVDFVFTEAVGPTQTPVSTCNSAPFVVGTPTVSADRLTVSVPITNPMPAGTCTVVLTISAADSTPNGNFSVTFTIAADTPAVAPTVSPAPSTVTTVAGAAPITTTAPAVSDAAGSESAGTNVGGPLGLARVLSMLGLAVLLGSLVLIVTAWPEGVEYILTVRFLRSAWAVGMVGSVLSAILLRAQVTGESVGSSISPSSWFDLTDTTPGTAALARVAFAAACVWVVIRPERVVDQNTQLPALALPVLAVATFGLSRTGGDIPLLGVVAGVGHAVAMAVWLGGVVLLTRVVLAGPGEDDLVHAVRGFSRISTPALLVTVATGAIQTWRLDGGTLFETSHGRMLLLKTLVVGAMVFVGLATRQFVRQRLRKIDSMTSPLASRLQRATGLEAVGGIVVLALTAWLLSMQPGGVTVADGPVYDIETQVTVADLDLTVRLTGDVGRNGVRVDIDAPATGVSALVLTFTAPAGTTAAGVVLTIPAELTGADIGAAELPLAIGIPLDVAGVWTLQVDATTPAGPQSVQKNFTLVV